MSEKREFMVRIVRRRAAYFLPLRDSHGLGITYVYHSNTETSDFWTV